MDDLLAATSTRSIKEPKEEEALTVSGTKTSSHKIALETLSPDSVLNILQSEPDFDSFYKCLQWLVSRQHPNAVFNIKIPSPKAARILNALVNDVAPNYWPILRDGGTDHANERKLFLSCLSSVAGIGALAARLGGLATSRKASERLPTASGSKSDTKVFTDTLNLLESVLRGDKAIDRIAKDIFDAETKKVPPQLLWKELMSWIAGGRLISIAAESILTFQAIGSEGHESWLGSGKAYATWLAKNIRSIESTKYAKAEEGSKAKAQLFGRALSLGYTDQIIETVFQHSLEGQPGWHHEKEFFSTILPHERRATLFTLLRVASKRPRKNETAFIKGLGALIYSFLAEDPALSGSLVDWIAGASGQSIGLDICVHRAVIAALSSSIGDLEQAIKQIMTRFGDKIWMQHTPVLHQEVQTQDLLLLIGHVHKLKKDWLHNFARSSTYINAISKRLAASSSRVRFLGMILGMAVSELVDPVDKRMTFGLEEMEGNDGKWYRGLIRIFDSAGSVHDLKLSNSASIDTVNARSVLKKAETKSSDPQSKISKIIAIEEIEDESENDDDNLLVYAKPDSDPEDEDEDPTLIQRNKPTPPVYIRELILGLRDNDNYDRHRLALEAASDLIRRKANYGTEVSDHAEDLATQLAGLKDQYKMDNFQEMRLKGMIAIIVAHPQLMGKWFSNSLFTGDYSMSQRASMMTSLSMAARELAGYREEDAALTGASNSLKDLFPSKRLPAKQEAIWSVDAAPLNAITQSLERTMIRPIAAEAADKLTGPNALKVRTFSSRMEVEKKRKRPITNELAKIVSENFFFPLTGRYRVEIQVHGSNSAFNTPFLLSHFLKTLGLILSASGSSTLSLPALTTEFWSLLLHLRPAALNALPVLEALLFCLMAILEINDNDQRQLVVDHSKELLETQAWVQQVFDNTRGGDEEGDRVRMLAAGILVRCSEVVEKYQRLMMGELVNYMH